MQTASKIITAKFSGKCAACHGVVPSGTKCYWERGAGVRHVTCPTNSHTNSNSSAAVTVTMGVFKKDDKIFVVKPNKDHTRVYAKEIVESPPRMTENGEVVDFETKYAPGVVYKLTEADRWDIADAQDFLTKYSRCIVCGRHLKAAKSVAHAIGPVCAKYFAHNKTYTAKAVEHITPMPSSEPIADVFERLEEKGAFTGNPAYDDAFKKLASLCSASAKEASL